MDESFAKYNKVVGSIFRGVSLVYHKTHWFTDKEAWTLFRLFAFGETAGWTLLISAIVYRGFELPGYAIAVSIAGTVHGLLFSLYFLFVLLTARSMQWGVRRISVALLAGMPPYTSLVFEKIMAHHRKKHPVYIEPPKDLD